MQFQPAISLGVEDTNLWTHLDRILRTEYLDKNALYIKLMQELKSNAPLSREKHVSPSLYRAMQVTERVCPPLFSLPHVSPI